MKKLIIVIPVLLFIACAHGPVIERELTPEQTFQRAYQAFEEEDYGKSIEIFKYFFNHFPGSKLIDKAQFYYAECYYFSGDYQQAVQEYQFLIQNFPNSEFAEKSLLRKARCLEEISPIVQRDQRITREALNAYDEFLLRYPYSEFRKQAEEGKKRVSEKLNRKLVDIANIYIKMNRNEAASIYLKEVIEGSDSWDDLAYLKLGKIACSREEDSLALYYLNMVGGEYREEAEKEIEKLRE